MPRKRPALAPNAEPIVRNTRAKTIEALEAKSVADEKKIKNLEAYKKWASGIRQKHDQRFRAYKKWAFAIQKANFKRKREDKARIAKLRLDVSEGERACVELADVKKKMAENAVALHQQVLEQYRTHTKIDLQLREVQGRALDLMKELQTLKTQLGIIIEV